MASDLCKACRKEKITSSPIPAGKVIFCFSAGHSTFTAGGQELDRQESFPLVDANAIFCGIGIAMGTFEHAEATVVLRRTVDED